MNSFLRSSFILYVLILAGCAVPPEPPGLLSFENVTEQAGLIEPLKGITSLSGLGKLRSVGEMGLYSNPDLVSAHAAVREHEYGVASASAGFLPQIDASVGAGIGQTENDGNWTDRQDQPGLKAILSLRSNGIQLI